MNDAVHDIFAEWTLPIWLTLSMVLTAIIYLRGWSKIRRTRPEQFTGFRLASFLSGLGILWLAIGSPMDGFADALLSAHMVEHLLLMSAVPPLLLMGLPGVPLLRGLPEWLLRLIARPLLRLSVLRRIGHWLATPIVAWLAMNLTFLAWHIPGPYCFALEHEGWHDVEHLCFLSTSILFWWCLLRPWPTSAHRMGWGALIYLVSADVVNTILSAFLSFYGKPIYSYYVDHPNPFHILALDDQILGAAIMWVIGSLAYLVPAVWITFHLLRPIKLSYDASSLSPSTYKP
jgi:putative membrane protein